MGPNRYYLLVASCMDAEVRKDEAIYNFSVCSLETLTMVMMHVGWPSTWLVSKLWGNLFHSGFFQNVSLVTVISFSLEVEWLFRPFSLNNRWYLPLLKQITLLSCIRYEIDIFFRLNNKGALDGYWYTKESLVLAVHSSLKGVYSFKLWLRYLDFNFRI